MRIKDFVKKITTFYINGYKGYHLSIFLISSLISVVIFLKKESTIKIDDYINILNSIGLLTGFFFIAIDKVSFEYMDENFKNDVEINFISKFITAKTTTIPENTVIKSTMFSIVVSIFLLICLQYILILFSFYCLFLLIMTILYVFLGFIYTVVVWEFFTSKR